MCGTIVTSETISVDGKKLTVRLNTWNFLHQMQSEGYTGSLWIYTIVIDPEDLAEQGQQAAIVLGGVLFAHSESPCLAGTSARNEDVMRGIRTFRTFDWETVRQKYTDDKVEDSEPKYARGKVVYAASEDFFEPTLDLFSIDYRLRL